MTSKDFLKLELERINDVFTNAVFSYEFINSERTHIIDVRPSLIFDSEDFLDVRFDLREQLSERFPSDSILFISENSLNKIICPEFVISKYLLKPTSTISLYNFTVLDDSFNLSSVGENHYALAA